MVDFSAMDKKQATPKAGVGILFVKDGNVLMMKRKGSHGANTWSLPGGHLDVGEDFLTCCDREAEEEVGVRILTLRELGFENNLMASEGLHYVTLFFQAHEWEGEFRVVEEDKCDGLGWFSLDDLPSPLFGALPNFFSSVTLGEGYGYSDAMMRMPVRWSRESMDVG